MSSDTADEIAPVRSPRTSSVEPPPMSITRTGASGAIRTPLSAPRKESRASSLPVITSGRTPSRDAIPVKKSSTLRASRAAEVATTRVRSGATS